jgi:hypothetical protein
MAEVLEVGDWRWAHHGNNKGWLQRIGQKQRKKPHSKQAAPATQFSLAADPAAAEQWRVDLPRSVSRTLLPGHLQDG